MKFEDVVDFPNETEAYMIVRDELGLTEEEYLSLTWIERKELATAYRIAKKLGVEQNALLQELYADTRMFDENGVYDLSAATIIVKEKAGILSVAKTKLGLTDTIEEFVLRGDIETKKIAADVRKVLGDNLDDIVEHLRNLFIDYDNVQETTTDSKFNFE